MTVYGLIRRRNISERGIVANYTFDRTNLVKYSEEFDNAVWTKTRSAVATNVTSDPDGSYSADLLFEDSSLTSSHYLSQTSQVPAGSAYASIYAKAGTRTHLSLQLWNSTDNAVGDVTFDLSGGVILTTTAGAGAIVSAGNGWYRCSVSATATVASSLLIALLHDGSSITYTGDGTSGLYIWGAMVNPGSFLRPYQRTQALQLLINEASGANQNMMKYTEVLDNAAWIKQRVTVTADAVANPLSGTTAADKIVEDTTATNNHFIYQTITGLTIGTNYCYSIYLKAGERNNIRITDTSGVNIDARSSFDLSTGTPSVSVGTAGSEDVGNGWYRVWVAGQLLSSTSLAMGIFLYSGANATYTGDGTSGIYAFGAMLNIGLSPRPYQSSLSSGALFFDERSVSSNWIAWSEEFDRASWTKSGSTVTANDASNANPLTGETTADRLNEDTSTGVHSVFQAITKAAVVLPVSCSLYAKAGTRTQVKFFFHGLSTSDGVYAIFDLSAGSVGAATTIGDFTSGAASIVSVGNSWYRCCLTAQSDDSTSVTMNIRIYNGSTDSYTGVAANNLYIWGAMINPETTILDYEKKGLGVYTINNIQGRVGYHGQLGSTAGVDTNDPLWQSYALKFDGSNDYVLTPVLMPSTGTLSVLFRAPATGATKTIIGVHDGSSGRLYLQSYTTGVLNPGIGAIGFTGTTTMTVGNWYLVTLTWDGARIITYIDGEEEDNRTYTGTPTSVVPLYIGALNTNGTLGGYFNEQIGRVILHNRALSASDVRRLVRRLQAEASARGIGVGTALDQYGSAVYGTARYA